MGAQAAAHPVRPRCPRLNTIIAITLLLISSIHHGYVSAEDQTALALLKFKTALANTETALANWNGAVHPCPHVQGYWTGVLCFGNNVLGLQLENMKLRGQIDVDALAPLQYLRSLSFMNNEFQGPMPDWRKLGPLKSLYLSNNQFSGQIAEDAFRGMTSLKKVHLANNKFTGPIPSSLESPKLIELRLENNQFTGTIPAISSDFLKTLNVSNNKLSGPIPAPLTKLDPSSFSGNGALCGAPLQSCDSILPPPGYEPDLHPDQGQAPSSSSSIYPTSKKGFSSAIIAIIIVAILLGLFLLILLFLVSRRARKNPPPPLGMAALPPASYDKTTASGAVVMAVGGGETVAAAGLAKKADQQQPGKLSFVRDDRDKFDLQDLMRASAEVLGSGNFGASYKAVLVDGEALVVKRFKQMSAIDKEDYHEHMRRLGRLKHPNILPLVAYLYRKEEKLLVFDFVHNGSLASQLHGKRAEDQPGLSWEIRLKIIKGVVKGLAYLQGELQSLTVAHGHLKSSNVLLDKDYNAVLMDYTLVPVVNPSQVQNILVAYKSPEYAQLGRTCKKTDVWCLGVLILETLTGKLLAKHLCQGSKPYGTELAGWINETVRLANTNSAEVFDKDMKVENSSCRADMEKLLQIGISCCKEDIDERLDLEEALRQIEQIPDSH